MGYIQTSLLDTDNYLEDNICDLIWNKELSRIQIQKRLELINSKKEQTAAYYTDPEIVINIVKELPSFSDRSQLTILEPSVGVGSFLWEVSKRYSEFKLDFLLVDIDEQSLVTLKELLKRFPIKNASFHFINSNFLKLESTDIKVDLIIGNPPFGSITKKDLTNKVSYLSSNLATIFLEKILNTSAYISMIMPKSVLSAPSFQAFRQYLKMFNIKSIIDFGENGFKGVKIETLNLMIDNTDRRASKDIRVISLITEDSRTVRKDYIIDPQFPYWLLYRNRFFDSVANKLDFDAFYSFRDRQVTKKITTQNTNGTIWVLRSRNFPNGEKIKHIPGYDRFIDPKVAKGLKVYDYINKNVYLMPNLSYKPRSTKLPENTIVDGSLALLIPKNRKPTAKQLSYYASSEFRKFYKIARNLGTRSLNIDKYSVFFFGLLK